MKRIFLLTGLIFFCFACGSNQKNAAGEQKDTTKTAVQQENAQTPALNADSIMKIIDAENSRIEASLKTMKKTVIKTKELREQIKQKWSEIEYYSENGQIVKVVTLPYPQITKRTEEFTYQNGLLILAMVGDKGLNEDGKAEKKIDKAYYFHGGACIKEDNRSKEEETTIRNSDNERLLQEAGEYLELFPKK
jgi:hypothetical protein